jgi:hypothetical protein
MLTNCALTHRSSEALREAFSVPRGEEILSAQLEFKEMPYFLVSRSRENWDFEMRGDINAVLLVGMTDRGLLVDPSPKSGREKKVTLIPWANVISLTVTTGAGGTADQS